MSILDKCKNFRDAEAVKKAGLYPYFREIDSEQDTWVTLEGGKRVLMLGSNSYMGLTNHPEVIEAAVEATRKLGTGCAGSRFLNGTLKIHRELEEKLAEFMGTESALVFSTGFQTNIGTISALVGRNDFVITDKFDHASIYDGARLSFGKAVRFEHNDMADLEAKLAQIPEGRGKLIVVDGIFSMEGDIAKLPEICELAEKFGAEVFVDDAHAIGVLGPNGEGTAAHFGLGDKVTMTMGTFSKSLASLGGFLAAGRETIEFLKHKSRALIFSASPSPANVSAAMAALEIIKREPERRERLWENTRFMLESFSAMGFDTGSAETPIVPLHVGDMQTAFMMSKMLEDRGVFVNPVVPPATPPGDCLIRVSFMATHTREDLAHAIEIFRAVGTELNII
ncbi:MAG TPA: pyridoxal phosphate-dependent aminotransferase family protein [candidate division Zixibacteria bacterium]|nr:pyridoxal phosphate-dependent aminotransferase family protein [candidate division Zixibacteria bacterium]